MLSATPTRADVDRALTALFGELAERRVRCALLRRPSGRPSDGPLQILVADADQARLAEVLLDHDRPAGNGSGNGAGGGAHALPPIEAVTRLLYGRATVGTGEAEERILGRAVSADGVPHLSAADELIDLLLYGLLDLRGFTPEHRKRLAEVVDELRADPVAAGRAAERTQQELAPAITWHELLADVTQERWDALAARGRRLHAQLLAKHPLTSLARLAAPKARTRTQRIAPPDDANGARRSPNREPPNGARGTPDVAERLNRKQIRGSGLLLAGRGISTGLKFLAELLVVRYLSTAAYGSWTWALSAVVLLESFSTMGLNRAIPRFVPLHLERKEREALFGVLLFVLGTLFAVGFLVVLAFHAFPGWVASLAGASPGQPLDILFIIIFLIPIHGVGNFATVLCAALGDSRTIFFRRYVLQPVLILAIALVLVLMEADVRMLAYGWVLASLTGILYYAVSLFRALRRQGLLAGGLDVRMPLPVRRVFSYTLPVMASDWFRSLMTTPAPLLLGYFSGMSTVALYQVAIPLVALNTQVSQSFVMMFEPFASRVFARGDRVGLENLYWRSAAWVAVLSFPGFAVSFALADPLTTMLYGERYQAAAPILSLLAVGTFVNAALGFNDAALRVSGNIRWLMAVNMLGAVLNIVLNLLLIPPMGALGAAVATGTSLLIYALAKQYCLWRATGVRIMHPKFLRAYAALGGLVLALALLRTTSPSNLWILVPAVLVSGLVLVLVARSTLAVSETFPELARWPLLGRLLG